MTKEDILRMCDHTVLRTDAGFEEIAENLRLAMQYNCASMCLAPSHVYEAKKFCGDKLKICTVVGFPNGYKGQQIQDRYYHHLGYPSVLAKLQEFECQLSRKHA